MNAVSVMSGLNAHERPPKDLKAVFKRYQSISHKELAKDSNIVQGDIVETLTQNVVRTIDTARICFEIVPPDQPECPKAPVLEWTDFPGLHFIPGFLTETVQIQLLSRTLHRDLANPQHQTNIHKHYNVPYEFAEGSDFGGEESFFNASPNSNFVFQPLDPEVHNPLTVSKFLNKKLRWTTLGGQYDWTEKVYPEEQPPEFPPDIASLIQKGFPDITPQAAIVNVYSPGDTLALHRDVSEISDQGLVSISIGCEAIFIVGLATATGEFKWRAFLLRSGDAIYMSGKSRYAWHGVPKIFKDTCPLPVQAWPAGQENQFEDWRGWMAGKRINLNVRQMFDNNV